MNEANETSIRNNNDHPKESLIELLRRCPIDVETWKIILDRPDDSPREISFDDWRFEDQDEAAENK